MTSLWRQINIFWQIMLWSSTWRCPQISRTKKFKCYFSNIFFKYIAVHLRRFHHCCVTIYCFRSHLNILYSFQFYWINIWNKIMVTLFYSKRHFSIILLLFLRISAQGERSISSVNDTSGEYEKNLEKCRKKSGFELMENYFNIWSSNLIILKLTETDINYYFVIGLGCCEMLEFFPCSFEKLLT